MSSAVTKKAFPFFSVSLTDCFTSFSSVITVSKVFGAYRALTIGKHPSRGEWGTFFTLFLCCVSPLWVSGWSWRRGSVSSLSFPLMFFTAPFVLPYTMSDFLGERHPSPPWSEARPDDSLSQFPSSGRSLNVSLSSAPIGPPPWCGAWGSTHLSLPLTSSRHECHTVNLQCFNIFK